MAAVKTKSKQDKITVQQFEALCSIQCTQEEICAVLNCCYDTMEAWVKRNYDGRTFSEVFKEKRQGGKASLRRTQWGMAQTNPTMAIWLGKQYLGQTDKNENTNLEKITIVNDIDKE